MTAERAGNVERVMRYHIETAHQPHRFARSLGYLDWATQPDPFRRYDGAPVYSLGRPEPGGGPRYDDLFARGIPPASAVSRETVSWLLFHSLALSAWKQIAGGNPWSLRVNPSSGNLHPTEGYVITDCIDDEPAVFHYRADIHALEQRAKLPHELWERLRGLCPAGGLLMALTSIHWRESWKYGERAFRYCQHDVGHAIGALTIAARCLGWQARVINGISTADLESLLGVSDQGGPEAEHGDCLLAIVPGHLAEAIPGSLTIEQLPGGLQFVGTPNPLSHGHQEWPIIEDVCAASEFPGTNFPTVQRYTPRVADGGPRCAELASTLVRRRRSAVAMDGVTSIPRDTFLKMMARLCPVLGSFPHDALGWEPQVSLLLFVHRVDGFDPGVYFLARGGDHPGSARDAFRREFLWERPDGVSEDLPLYLLHRADCRRAATMVSCQQEIAGDGVFSLGMLARFEEPLHAMGAWMYPRLFWETGLIGQILYLEAEAAGIQGTGIGCFFDDSVHEIAGITDLSWKSLYHFTVGGGLVDDRLRHLDPYHHVDEED